MRRQKKTSWVLVTRGRAGLDALRLFRSGRAGGRRVRGGPARGFQTHPAGRRQLRVWGRPLLLEHERVELHRVVT